MAEAKPNAKKVKPPPPPPPAAVMTASLIIRGSLGAVIGQKLGGTCTAVMPILSEPGCGKVSISIKGAALEKVVRSGEAAQTAIFNEVEKLVGEAVAADYPVHRIHFGDAGEAASVFGDILEDKSVDKKAKNNAAAAPSSIEVLYVPGVNAIRNTQQGPVCSSTGALGGVTFDHSKGGCVVDCGKKAMIVVKFCVANANAEGRLGTGGTAEASLQDAAADAKLLNQCEVRGRTVSVVEDTKQGEKEVEEEAPEDPNMALATATAVAKHSAALEAASRNHVAALNDVAKKYETAIVAVESASDFDTLFCDGAELDAVMASAKEVLDREGILLTKENVVTKLKEAHQKKRDGLTKQKLEDLEEATRELETELATIKSSFDKMKVDPWTVEGKVDYEKLISEFGSQLIDPDLLGRIERLTVGSGRVKKLHRFLRRSIFFSHRDLAQICDIVEKCKSESTSTAPFYLYTGRGPSSAAMHLGHLVPFMMTQWLQEAFDVPLVIQMTDDEKFLWKGEYVDGEGDNLGHFAGLTVENAKDIIACGFDKSKTFLFSDLQYMGHMYPNIVRIWKAVTYNQAKACFGFQGKSNIGQSAFPAIQAAPSFPSSFTVPLNENPNMPCLIPCAIDQDPYFRITRGIAHKIVPATHPLKGKPSLIHSKFFPPLQGAEGKMSSSNENSAIFLTDTPAHIQEKIKTHAFSGGQMTKKLQEEKGADLEADVSFQWLCFFMEDDEELERIRQSYGSGKGEFWSTALVKEKLIEILQELIAEHQQKRALITDEEVKEWMAVRRLNC